MRKYTSGGPRGLSIRVLDNMQTRNYVSTKSNKK